MRYNFKYESNMILGIFKIQVHAAFILKIASRISNTIPAGFNLRDYNEFTRIVGQISNRISTKRLRRVYEDCNSDLNYDSDSICY